MSLPIRLADLPKSTADDLMRYPNTWIATLLHVKPQAIEGWRLRHGYAPATGRGGAPRPGRDEFFERWGWITK